MGVIGSLGETTEKAAEKAQKYIETSKAYFTLKIFQQVSILVGVMGKAMVIGGLLFIAFLFIAIASAIALGNAIDSIALGILIIGILFMLIAFIAFKYRGYIDTIIIKKMGPKFFESK